MEENIFMQKENKTQVVEYYQPIHIAKKKMRKCTLETPPRVWLDIH